MHTHIHTHIYAYADEPREASFNPLFVLDWPHIVVRGDEVLDFHLLEFAHEAYSTYLLYWYKSTKTDADAACEHLLEFARAEDEVARRDFVAADMLY
jgi:hypothetical protein